MTVQATADVPSALGEDTRESLRLIVESLARSTGFEECVLHVVVDDRLTPVAGVGAAAEDTPAATLTARLDEAEDWGLFKLLPRELATGSQLAPEGWEPLRVPTLGDDEHGHDRWHDGDVAVAPLRDAEGRLQGMLTVARPADGLRPGPAGRDLLNQSAELAGRAVAVALEREKLASRARLTDLARHLIRTGSRALTLDALFTQVGPTLMTSFGLAGMTARVFETEGSEAFTYALGADTLPNGLGVDQAMPPATLAALPILWAEQRAGVTEHPSMVYSPIGAGDTMFGAVAMFRPPGAPAWAEAELENVFDITRDLGRAILNAMTFEREQRSARELRTLDAYKSELIATVAHELKNPITAILTNLEMLDDPELEAEYTERAVASLDRSTQRMVQIVNELRTLSDTDRPEKPLRADVVDLAVIARNVIDLVSVAAEQRQLSLALQTTDEDVLAVGDADELDRMLVNLVSNAVKYTPDGGQVGVILANAEDLVELKVVDSGIGISKADQAQLFSEFFRSDDPAANKQPGTGLGLAIVDRIVKRHGGAIAVASVLGQGTVFTVRLPRFGGPAWGMP